MTEPEEFTGEVRTFKAIINPFGGPWWKHPVSWWKMRHFRKDSQELEKQKQEDPTLAAISDRLDQELERAFIFGDQQGEDVGT